jgi:hypothetical protein
MICRLAVALLLLATIAALAPLAYVCPPDPTWIHGFWDDADHDDVILRVVSDNGAIALHSVLGQGSLHVVLNAVSASGEGPAQSWSRSSVFSRAPPTS